MTHQHQFSLIEQARRKPKFKPNPGVPERWEDEFGATVGCPICGEVRTVWSNGEIEIKVKGKDEKTTGEN